MQRHKVSESQCPACSSWYDGATGLNTDNRPQAGDILICIDCKVPSMLQPDNSRRFLTESEMVELRRQLAEMGSN